ncbi:uncharacterized protein LOC104883423 [Beta vulgaris subsp. vulgaris]|uniref:uncharacterized protein LOC104883423 n=1 Tax=Beta vulgaris subsp. vulgaris TaxID=3555 RepID=UPI002037622F|nr:uncharacterized protein LOC104883423 [Beta vulgaris subsp. vulgaris]
MGIPFCSMPPRRTLDARKEATRRRRQALENAIISLANRGNVPAGGQSVFDRFDRHRPPTYEGATDPVILESWLREMEKMFAATGCPAAEMVPIGTYYLKMEADNWWSTIRASCMATPDFGWAQFVAKLKERFYPDELRWQKQEEFLLLSQGTLSIQEYTDKFTELSHFATTIVPTEAERVKRYIKRMDPKVRTYVMSSGASTFQGAYEIALSIHASVKEEAARVVAVKKPVVSFVQSPAKRLRYESSSHGGYQQGSGYRQGYAATKCRRCEKAIHPGKNCDGTTITCYYCREIGHKSFQCPKNPSATSSSVGPTQSAGSSVPPKNRVYVMTQAEANVHPDAITGTFLINNVPAYVLFDTGASVSVVSSAFVKKANLTSRSPVRCLISLASGESYPCYVEYKDVSMVILGTDLPADLKEFDFSEFDVMLGVD